MKNWPKFQEFCYQSWNFTNFIPELYQICIFFPPPKDVESLHFPTFSAKRCEHKINKRDVHGKVMEQYFVKSVGTLKKEETVILANQGPF